jgi:tetratricopeptide (TPR) repeat protein
MNEILNNVAQLVREGQLQTATGQLEQILRSDPENTKARHLLGICQRREGQPDKALATQRGLIASDPTAAAVHQEIGLCLNKLRRFDEAIEAFSASTRLDPGLLASWKALGDAYMRTGRPEQAIACYERDPALGDEHPVFARAREFQANNLPGFANFLFLKYSEMQPDDGRGLRECARIASAMGAVTDAMNLLEKALERSPGLHEARFELAQALSARQRYAQALEHLQTLLEANPDHQPYHMMQASLLDHLGRFSEAESTLADVNRKAPGQPAVLLAMGHVQRTRGDVAAAEASYYSALQADPTAAEPWFALANLKQYDFSDKQVEAMRRSLDRRDTPPKDQVHFHFALGKALEDRGNFDQAFDHYEMGNQVQAGLTPFDGHRHSQWVQELIEAFDGLEALPPDDEKPAPVFVVGLPRSGSTLVEHILAAHSRVEGLGELANVGTLLQAFNHDRRRRQETPYPEALADVSANDLAALGRQYLEDTRVRRSGRPWFVDKMPNNFEHIGLIARMLPGARFVDIRRHPMANGFSAFRQLFHNGQEWSYALEQIALYYRNYLACMALWDEHLPGRVQHLSYEELVENPEAAIRGLLDHLDLPLEQACMEFHRTERPVKSASSEQVRQPLHKDAVDYWRHFEARLQPLADAFEQHGVPIDG